MPLQFFINATAQSPGNAMSRSEINPQQVPVPWLTFGDKVRFNAFLIDGIGGYDDRSGSADYLPALSVGIPGQPAIAVAVSFAAITFGWSAMLPLNGTSVQTAVGVNPSVDTYLNFKLTENATSMAYTFLSQEMKVLNKVN